MIENLPLLGVPMPLEGSPLRLPMPLKGKEPK